MSPLDHPRLSVREVAARCGVHPATVARWVAVGVGGRRLPSILVGGRRYVLAADLDRFVAGDGGRDLAPARDERRRRDAEAAKILDGLGCGRRATT